MQPWCAEGKVLTAANLNLYRGWKSCVGWQCDDGPLFGKCGDAKLIVSVSLGNFALFRWRRQSCSSDEGRSCRLGHGDILVMDGAVCQRVRRVHQFLLWRVLFMAFFFFFWFLLGVLCIWES